MDSNQLVFWDTETLAKSNTITGTTDCLSCRIPGVEKIHSFVSTSGGRYYCPSCKCVFYLNKTINHTCWHGYKSQDIRWMLLLIGDMSLLYCNKIKLSAYLEREVHYATNQSNSS